MLTDLAAESAPLLDGHAHAGIMRAATALLASVRPVLDELRTQYAPYSLRVTGHSLGAGTAAVVALLLAAEGVAVRGLAFGCPPVFSHALATGALARRTVTTVALNHDLVCRASIGAVNCLRRDADELVWASCDAQRLMHGRRGVRRCFRCVLCWNRTVESAS